MKTSKVVASVIALAVVNLTSFIPVSFAENSALDILKQGLLGAGTGAIASSASGGNAGKGALIGAGTNVIGGALLGFLTNSSGSSHQSSYSQSSYSPYYTSAPVQSYSQPVYYYEPQPVYTQSAPVYVTQPRENSNQRILKQGILGAGVGAISASASGGKAGQGALIGAGTNVIGGALLDVITTPSTSQTTPVYYAPQPYASTPTVNSYTTSGLKKHIIRKFDSNGKMISEDEFWE